MIATIVAIAGVVTGLIGATVPVMVALIQKRRAEIDEEDDDMPAPQLGMPIPATSYHSEGEYELLREQLQTTRDRCVELAAQNALLTAQQLTAYAGWSDASSRLQRANEALRAAGLPTY